MAVALLTDLTEYSQEWIGAVIRIDRSTVSYHQKKHRGNTDKIYLDRYNKLKTEFSGISKTCYKTHEIVL
jgi:hypothetical protein